MGHGPRTLGPAALSTVLLLVIVGCGLVVGPSGRLDPPTSQGVAVAGGFVPVGLFLLRYRPASRTARLTWVIGAMALLGLSAAAWSGTTPGAWLTQWSWWPPLALTPVVLLGFPDRVAGGRTRTLAILLVGVAGLSTVVLAAAASLAPRTLLTDTDAPLPPGCRTLLAVFAGLATISVLGLAGALWVLLRRAHRNQGALRGQILWLTPAAALMPVGIALDATGVPYALTPAVLALPLGIGAAILEHRLDDLDQVVPRGAVRVTLTMAVVALYAGILILVDAVARTGRPGVAAVLVLAGVAVVLDPVRRRLQQLVERLLYGQRDDPYAVLSDLGRRLAAVSAPEEMLRTSAEAIVETLRVPRALVSVDVNGHRVVVADVGRADTDVVMLPLTREGNVIGELTVWTRRRGDPLGTHEHALLEEVARQAAEAAEAHRLTLALRAARERLVLSREEERLRLRRDFHDGVGPVIAGIRMQLHATLPRLDAAERDVVSGVLTDLGALGRSVREIVDELRPADLDRGLEAAVRRAAASVLAGLDVQIEIEGSLDGLPPAAEVAAYRITAEALHNVARHSGATHAQVGLKRSEGLRILVCDNGSGVRKDSRSGVGTASMRARADELGGHLILTSDENGTQVTATIPVATFAAGVGEVGTTSR